MKTLVYFAHPRGDRSEISAPMFAAAQQHPDVTTVDLYAQYPTFDIDVRQEQSRLLDHDAIVFLHPLYWYSAPAIVKEYQDLVLQHGFAYGQDGDALRGKTIFHATSCGAPESAYRPGGSNGAHLRDLLMPFEKSADLCGMAYLAPFVLYSAGHAVDEGRDLPHLTQWHALLDALTSDTLDIAAARSALTLNEITRTLSIKQEPA